MNQINVVNFFEEDYVNQASYDNLRKIASCIDGLKNANRKVIHTILDKNIWELTKVSQLSAKAGEYTDYLHGSLDGVVVTLAQDYLTTNQIPLLAKKGNFGTRAIQDASASRYIFACGSPILKKWFNEVDKPQLIQQMFEGTKIEPKFFVPDLPVLLINGSRGVSSGFAQYILPRPLVEIEKIIKQFCKEQNVSVLKSINRVKPFIGNFNGVVERDYESQNADIFKWLFTVNYEIQKDCVIIKDIPYGEDLRGYLQTLDKLEEDKKIKSYEDLSDGDSFLFKVKVDKKFDFNWSNIIKTFKLQTSVTENFTCMDENNKILEAQTPFDILERYVAVKVVFLGLRKEHLMCELSNSLDKMRSIAFFIQSVISGKFDPKGKKTVDFNEFFNYNKLYKDENDSHSGYGYLHRVQMGKMAEDEIQAIKDKIAKQQQELENIERSSIYELWLRG